MSGKNENRRDDPDNVDQIRDILFGGQMREYEKRFGRMDEQMQSAARQLRTDLDKRIDQLESYVRKECDKISEKTSQQIKDQRGSLKQVESTLKEQGELLRSGLAEVTSRFDSEIAGLRDELHQQARHALQQMQQRSDDVAAQINRETRELRESLPARSELAALFSELALRLGSDDDTTAT